MRSTLRLFRGQDEAIAMSIPKKTMTFGQLTQLLTEAVDSRRTWVHDFADDEVAVTQDLFELLTAYSRVRPGA